MPNAEKTNIVLIMCDQLRFDVLGCMGNALVKTPNIDRIAATGAVFTQAYSQTPVCIPARHALIFGQNSFEIGLCENASTVGKIENPLPKMVRDMGYYTCAVGKMHFLPAREHFGFDKMYLSEEIPSHAEDDEYIKFLLQNGIADVFEPHGKRSGDYYVPQISELSEEYHTTAWTAKTTAEVIRKNINRPFFLFSSFIKPHPPFDPCAAFSAMYNPANVPGPSLCEDDYAPVDEMIPFQNGYKVGGFENVTDEQIRKIRAYYYASISQVDKYIGIILDEVDRQGLSDNTMVIFTADHGEMLGDHRAFGKRTYYEQSTKIPYIISLPGTSPRGAYKNALVTLQDLYATICDVAGCALPATSSGKSLVKLCMGEDGAVRDAIVAEYGAGRNFKCMLRWDKYKYIYFANGGREQLFDLSSDPAEQHNMAALNAPLCGDCRRRLYKYYSQHGYAAALGNNELKKYDYEPLPATSFLNQTPAWPSTVV